MARQEQQRRSEREPEEPTPPPLPAPAGAQEVRTAPEGHIPPPATVAPLCPNAVSTQEMNACFGERFERAEKRMDRYLAEALEQQADSPELARGIEAAHNSFVAYRERECATLHERWKDGTIRTVMGLGCRTELTDQRTLALWRNWLTYADSTPPVLPEPAPTR